MLINQRERGVEMLKLMVKGIKVLMLLVSHIIQAQLLSNPYC